ncbi:ABC transporter permease [uncultured Actinomyces sp.]|uniref:ABC transporter permease n=1 Tax=uncultured Actinomyces sp. TaxID=249061 RepID=UPI0028EE5DD9|nr:ABC transporter permease [uncultured Actinomyces sp.]
MLRYIGRRLLQTIPVFFGATFLIFAMVYLMPGDPVAALGGDRGLTEAAAAQIRAEYHLDQPFWMQYLLYLKGVFTLDFGKSFNQQPVIDVMARAFPTTIALAIYALAIESIFGITLGVIAGVRRGGWFDSTILVFSLLLISVPTFVLGFVLQFLLGFKLGVLPVTASASVNMASLTMPAMVLGGVSLAYVIRLTRQSVSENVSADYVRTARAKGLTNRAVMTRHILRNSLIPVATFLGGDLGALMGGAIITEGIFNINGVGGTLWQAIRLGEAPTVVSITTVLVLVYILANLIVDLLYAVLDPRIRYE